jgi:hypothetical protein
MRRDRQRLRDTIEALHWVTIAVAGRAEDHFAGDARLPYAIAQQLTMVEAAARRGLELMQWYPPVPKAHIVCPLENFSVHHYLADRLCGKRSPPTLSGPSRTG